jgi:putative heme-binding domain-containing protein
MRPWYAAVILLTLVASAPAAEKWADPNLKTTQGLVLWLDAARQPDAWKANGKPPLVNGAALDVAYDAAGSLHLAQPVKDAQPHFVAAAGKAVLRFDGKGTFLSRTGPERTVTDFTLFVHAAARSNGGGFRAFFAAAETGKNDYVTGLNVDLGPTASARCDTVNVEGRGFGGAGNLLTKPVPFGEFHTFEVSAATGKGGVKLSVDGVAAGSRDRAEGAVRLDDLFLGARRYSNNADPPFASGFLDGDVAEVLLYDRLLTADEHKAVVDYLKKKHAGLDAALGAATEGVPLKVVADPPPVQMLLPGFTVRQLPVDLTNVNNLRYRDDGKLYALAYDGNVYLLSDTDGDGLEDKAELFWDNQGKLVGPIGMTPTPQGYKHGTGVFVASKGKLSLLVDTDGDGKADKEIVVAQGWQQLPVAVDALGVALDGDGNVYFGLGTADYSNAYLLDKDGKAHYDVKGERGTIQKVSADFSKRETVCTGIRFSVGMAFNKAGDLFCTDQEGATWLPNGNPFDELLHVEPGRHYGFPPRHPRHLTGVIDEPSVFDYGPQHQSTCGLVFNEPVNGGPVFGPAWWQGDALITGESRGKLFRTQLVKSAGGYVARNQLLACLNALAVDACVSPQGDLVVATHSGPPDWGTGPKGKGKLYKIHFTGKDSPQPVMTWAAGPREVRVAFDRPLDPQMLKDLAKQTSITRGQYVRPGDRFEVLKPPYAVVQMQGTTPRYDLPVLGVEVTPDRRTLVLKTAPHPDALSYALTLPGLGRPEKPGKGELAQHAAVDLGYDLTGVDAEWRATEGDGHWSGWLPHPDLAVARKFTAGSAGHEPLWPLLEKPGKLTLRAQLDLWQMLRPAVQPGSTLDEKLPPETVTVTFTAPGPLEVKAVGAEAGTDKEGRRKVKVTLDPKEGQWLPVEVVLDTGKGKPALEVTWSTKEDARPRALPLRRVLLPWAAAKPAEGPVVEKPVPELAGGSWTRGRAVFFSDEAQCAKCHAVRGRGGSIGPDLSNLVHRDYASVLRDVRDPSAALNPDYVSYVVELKDGRLLTGPVRTVGDKVVVGDASGREAVLPKDAIDTMTPSAVSVMPQGLDKQLGPDKLRDLLTFLLTQPLKAAPLEAEGAPPPRTRAEVEAVLKGAAPATGPRKKLSVVLAAGPKDHGPGEHDYPLWQRRWVNLLGLAEDVTLDVADGWPTPKQFETADVIVFYSSNPAWAADRGKELDAFLERGGGLVYLHWAVAGRKAVDELAERIGLAWKDGQSKFRHGPLELTFTDSKHPITRGFETVKFVDETYWQLSGDVKRVTLLATAPEEGEARPLLWAREQGKGRVFVSVLGHYTWTFDDPLFRVLVLRGIAWSAGEPADRFTDLATVGARMAD